MKIMADLFVRKIKFITFVVFYIFSCFARAEVIDEVKIIGLQQSPDGDCEMNIYDGKSTKKLPTSSSLCAPASEMVSCVSCSDMKATTIITKKNDSSLLQEVVAFRNRKGQMISSPPSDLNRGNLWEIGPFENPSREFWLSNELYPSKSGSSFQFTHELNPTVIVFRDSGWSKDAIKARLVGMAAALGKCGIKLTQTEVLEVDVPNSWLDVRNTHADGRQAKETNIFEITEASVRFADKPIFYYLRKKAPGGPAAFSKAPYFTKTYSMLNTVWITRDDLDRDPKFFDHFFSTELHELGHVLLNRDHLDKVPALLVRVKKSNVDTPQWLDEAVILEQKWIENFQKHLENPVFWRRLTIV